MSEKNDFKLDVVSIRLVKEAPIYSEQSFDKPEEVAAVMGTVCASLTGKWWVL